MKDWSLLPKIPPTNEPNIYFVTAWQHWLCNNSNYGDIIAYYTALHMHLRTQNVTLAHVILL